MDRLRLVIAVTGSLRNVGDLNKVLDGAKKLKDRFDFIDKIYLSTTDSSGQVANALKGEVSALEVICSAPPQEVTKGHRLHQLIQLSKVLEPLDDDVWVLKLRTDKLVMPISILEGLLVRLKENAGAFDGRIGVIEGAVFLPWYINDMVYIGQKKVLKSLVLLNTDAEKLSPALATEQVIWSALLGERQKYFFVIGQKNPLAYSLQPDEGELALVTSLEREHLNLLLDYWRCLEEKFFGISQALLASDYHLNVAGFDIKSNMVTSRYGPWGSVFLNPLISKQLISAAKNDL